jgi:protein O-GlcNAc transferase
VDVLVDLSGHTQASRTRALSARPAPVQISYLGFPGTLGASFVQYLVGDAYLTPVELEHLYDECVLRLPVCYMARPTLAPPQPQRAQRASLGLPEHSMVLCCFNNSLKIRPEMFDVWMRLLRDVPAAVLWLPAFHAAAERNLRAEARKRGVQADRLVFAPVVPVADHVRRLSAADLFLDTYPYSAGATAHQTLTAGVPLLTLTGDAYVSRMAGSLLNALGLHELIAGSLEDYRQRALALMQEPGRLADLRETLRAALCSTPLLDASSVARALEDSFEQAWACSRAAQPTDAGR